MKILSHRKRISINVLQLCMLVCWSIFFSFQTRYKIGNGGEMQHFNDMHYAVSKTSRELNTIYKPRC